MKIHVCILKGTCSHVPVDVVFVIDMSDSVDDAFMPMVKKFLHDVYNQLGLYADDFRIGVVVYNDTASNYIYLNDQSDVHDKIASIPDTTTGGTDTNEGLELMIQQFEQQYDLPYLWKSLLHFVS
jgi:uncharacterized protein YegL